MNKHVKCEMTLMTLIMFTGAFELAIIRLSRYIDLQTNRILFDNLLLTPEAFFTDSTPEIKLIGCAYDLAKTIAELKLTDVELGLYSAAVLLSGGKHAIIHFLHYYYYYLANT